MTSKIVSRPPSYAQKVLLLNYLEENTDLIHNTKVIHYPLWKLLAAKLNKLEESNSKSVKQWKKFWSDWKIRIAKKVSKVKGVADPKSFLKDLELRVWHIRSFQTTPSETKKKSSKSLSMHAGSEGIVVNRQNTQKVGSSMLYQNKEKSVFSLNDNAKNTNSKNDGNLKEVIKELQMLQQQIGEESVKRSILEEQRNMVETERCKVVRKILETQQKQSLYIEKLHNNVMSMFK